jgi:hypothetical protein
LGYDKVCGHNKGKGRETGRLFRHATEYLVVHLLGIPVMTKLHGASNPLFRVRPIVAVTGSADARAEALALR